MKDQLSAEQIDTLFKFVKSKYVRYIDVQYEIVDHLASAIEEKQRVDPSLSFERALSEVYSKFPITGFAIMIVEKSSALTKFWLKKFLGFMLTYLKMPKILIAGFLIYFVHLILHTGFLISPKLLYILLILLSFSSALYRYIYGFEFSKEFRDKYLVTGTYLSFYTGLWFFYFYIPLHSVSQSIDNFGYWSSWILSVYVTSITLLLHAYTFVFPKMLKQELQEKYNHLNIKIV